METLRIEGSEELTYYRAMLCKHKLLTQLIFNDSNMIDYLDIHVIMIKCDIPEARKNYIAYWVINNNPLKYLYNQRESYIQNKYIAYSPF